MKKFYSLALTGLMVAGVSAQSLQKGSSNTNNDNVLPFSRIQVNTTSYNRAVGDTLLYAPFTDIYVNATDQAGFNLANDDQDGFIPNQAANGIESDWMFFYSLDPADFTPFDIASPWSDSAFFAAATSWFTPAGQANNWLSMGPITVPAVGAKLSWRVKTNPQFKDGYRVLVNGTGLDPVADFGSDEVIYSRADNGNNPTDNIDTVWQYYSANIPSSYNGNQVYFGFNHNANDMDMLYLDEILMVEFPTMGVENNQFDGFGLHAINPNPATEFAYINYEIGKVSDVTFLVTDINGRAVASLYQGSKETGLYNYPLNVTEFNSGIYFVTIKAGNYTATQKLVVAK